MRRLDGLSRETSSFLFSGGIPNRPTLQVGESRFRALKYLFQSPAAIEVQEPGLTPGTV